MEEAVNLFQLLVQAGAMPGEDFSCDLSRQSYRLSDRCIQLLREAYLQVDWDDVLGYSYNYNPQPAIDAIHQQLGVPFVDRLLERISSRLWTLPESQCLGYLNQMALGLEAQTGLLLYAVLQTRLDLATLARLEWLIRQEMMDPCDIWLEDLVLAAGGNEADVLVEEEGVALSERGVQLLTLVWAGEFELTPEPPAQL